MTIKFNAAGYKKAIENEFDIINKNQEVVPFKLNKAQAAFIEKVTGRDVVLKARQMGFSSLILAILTIRFILKNNERCVVVSHETGATQKLMDRVKFFIQSFEKKNNIKLPLKYNSRSEMVLAEKNNSFYIGTAGSRDFGRGDTITALHLSEFAFYQDPERVLAGVMQAVTPTGLVFIESTANGFNFFKAFWDACERGERNFTPHFYGPEWEYDEAFLEEKRKELGRFFPQEYPRTPQEAFLTSGDTYFNIEALQWYDKNTKDVIKFQFLNL